MTPKKSKPAGPGRPRCSDAHQALLDAARKMLETKGYGGVTIEGLARESGVSNFMTEPSERSAERMAR